MTGDLTLGVKLDSVGAGSDPRPLSPLCLSVHHPLSVGVGKSTLVLEFHRQRGYPAALCLVKTSSRGEQGAFGESYRGAGPDGMSVLLDRNNSKPPRHKGTQNLKMGVAASLQRGPWCLCPWGSCLQQ